MLFDDAFVFAFSDVIRCAIFPQISIYVIVRVHTIFIRILISIFILYPTTDFYLEDDEISMLKQQLFDKLTVEYTQDASKLPQ